LSVPGTIENCDSVRILEWHAAPGQAIEPGDLVVELETHKALIEVRAAQKGVLRRIEGFEGSWCPLDGPLALFTDTDAEPLPEGDLDAIPWIGDFTIG
jgi:pyruvate/2-oxoglutarate dehydrogenase complex dihydrolipoamide acyltransferase (E2) component